MDYKSEEQGLFEELEALRESGEMNMCGAPRWLRDNFDMSRDEANRIFKLWTESKEDEYGKD